MTQSKIAFDTTKIQDKKPEEVIKNQLKIITMQKFLKIQSLFKIEINWILELNAN